MRLSHFRQWLFDVAVNFSATFFKKSGNKNYTKMHANRDQRPVAVGRFPLSLFDTNGTILITDQLMPEVLAYLNSLQMKH
jgi:hypothetical protein